MQFERTKKRSIDVNLIPLINVVFLMLIFFMVAGKVENLDAFNIQTPHTKYDATGLYSLPTIFIGRTGKIAVNDDIIQPQDFSLVMQTILLENPDADIVIKTDKATLASHLIDVMNTIEKMGGKGISIIAELE